MSIPKDDKDWSDCPPFVFCTGPTKEEAEQQRVETIDKITRSARRWATSWKQYIQMVDNYFDQIPLSK